MPNDVHEAQNVLLFLFASLGKCALALTKGRYYPDVRCATCESLEFIFMITALFGFSIVEILNSKIMINKLKYPIQECLNDRKISKKKKSFTSKKNPVLYTRRIFTTNMDVKQAFLAEFPHLIQITNQFGQERGWQDEYTQENLLLSLAAEFGEAAEILQWMDKETKLKDLQEELVNRIAGEIADITIYLLHMCRKLSIDKQSISNTPMPYEYHHIQDS